MRLVTAAALLVVALPVAAEDLTIVSKTTGSGQPATSTDYMTATMARYQSGDSDRIIDLKAGRIVTIDHKKKQWSEITAAEIEAAMKKAQAQMEQAMAGMPPAVREKMQGMTGGAAASLKVTKGGSRTVAGYTCNEYNLSWGTAMTQVTCNTTAITMPFDPTQLRKLMTTSNPGMARMMGNMETMTKEMQQIKGLPIAETTTVHVMGKSMVTTKEATEIKKGPIPASVFEVPAGYKKVESPLAKMGER
jgi:hypothetical protein